MSLVPGDYDKCIILHGPRHVAINGGEGGNVDPKILWS